MDHLEHGRACYGRRAWSEAYHALLCADQATPLAGDDLDRLATAADLTGHDHEFQHLIERLYRVHVESGDRARAARAARQSGGHEPVLFGADRLASAANVHESGEPRPDHRECRSSGVTGERSDHE